MIVLKFCRARSKSGRISIENKLEPVVVTNKNLQLIGLKNVTYETGGVDFAIS